MKVFIFQTSYGIESDKECVLDFSYFIRFKVKFKDVEINVEVRTNLVLLAFNVT